MQRVIKIRVWDWAKRTMSEGMELPMLAGYLTGIYPFLGDETYCEFTGLLDMDGREIYEGMILRNTKTKEVFEVIYSAGRFEGSDRTRRKIGKVMFGPTFFPLRGKLQIIGNIYQNPELLKKV